MVKEDGKLLSFAGSIPASNCALYCNREENFMLDIMKQEANRAYTENGAATWATSGSDCLDLFAAIGALRRESDEEIIDRFVRAYTENPDIAMKLLFYARDVRGGLGERRVFRTILRWLAINEPAAVKKNLTYVAEYGRYDDLLTLFDTPCEQDMLELIRRQFVCDMENLAADESVSLLAKWLPSVNASNTQTIQYGRKMARAMGMKDAEYRKALSKLRTRINLIENHLREKDYSFAYEKQPSRAMFKYRRAFARNDGERYQEFLARVHSGESRLHADHVFPYELVEACLYTNWNWNQTGWMKPVTSDEKAALNAAWKALPDYGDHENTIAVIDTSGSMYMDARPIPAAVALSLGMYLAERNKGVFRNHFIEFSDRPQLIEIKGETFTDRLRYITTFCEVAGTNLEAVFDLILDAAVKHNVSQEEMPAKLMIISDMEFNACVENAEETNFDHAKKKYAAWGYQLPEIVFWNVASRNRQQPVTMNEQGVALVSGMTPRLFAMAAGGKFSPYTFMLEILGSARYAKIAA